MCVCVCVWTQIHKHTLYFFVRFSFLECKESWGYVSQWIINWLSASLRKQKRGNVTVVCFLLFSENKKLLLVSQWSKKKLETNTPSSWGHELTLVHFNMLLIPTWFLLFDGWSLLNSGKINSVSFHQAGRAGGKWVPLSLILYCSLSQSTQQDPSEIPQERLYWCLMLELFCFSGSVLL